MQFPGNTHPRCILSSKALLPGTSDTFVGGGVIHFVSRDAEASSSRIFDLGGHTSPIFPCTPHPSRHETASVVCRFGCCRICIVHSDSAHGRRKTHETPARNHQPQWSRPPQKQRVCCRHSGVRTTALSGFPICRISKAPPKQRKRQVPENVTLTWFSFLFKLVAGYFVDNKLEPNRHIFSVPSAQTNYSRKQDYSHMQRFWYYIIFICTCQYLLSFIAQLTLYRYLKEGKVKLRSKLSKTY